MASYLDGGNNYRLMLRRMPQAVRAEVTRGLETSVRRMQATAVALAPKMTGNMARQLLSARAIGWRENGQRVEFGFRTRAIAKKAFYAHFVHEGTRGYRAGDYRFKGIKKGNRKTGEQGGSIYVRIKRSYIPPRAANPFLRRALEINIPLHRRDMNEALRRAVRRARFARR